MSQRSKFIVLGALVALLAVMAYIQLARPKSPVRAENPPAESAPGAPNAPVSAGDKPANATQDSGPSAADLRELADWFGVPRSSPTVIAKAGGPVLGMSYGKRDIPASDVTASPEPTQIPWMTEPGKLDGIIKAGNGPRKALFQGELYQVGDRVRGTTYTIVTVDDDSVTLKSDDHVIRRFWHD